MILSAIVALVGCKKGDVDTMGRVQFSVECDQNLIVKSGVTEADMSTFIITLDRLDGWQKSFVYSELPEILEMVPGSYTITVTSPNAEPAKFEQPIFGGSAAFEILAGEVTPVSVVCSIQNVKVTFKPSADFNKELSHYTVTVSNGVNSLIWNKQDILDGKAGYFTVTEEGLSISVYGYRVIDDSTPVDFSAYIPKIMSREHHIINLDAKTTGALQGIQLSIDYTTNEKVQDVLVPGFPEVPVPGVPEGPDEGEDPVVPETPAIEILWDANPDFGVTELKGEYAPGEVDLTINAENTIQSFVVIIKSGLESFKAALMAFEGYEELPDGSIALDLMKPSIAEALGSMMPTGEQLKNKTTVEFSLGGLIPLMVGFHDKSTDVGVQHIFTLAVTDTKGIEMTKSFTFEYRGN